MPFGISRSPGCMSAGQAPSQRPAISTLPFFMPCIGGLYSVFSSPL